MDPAAAGPLPENRIGYVSIQICAFLASGSCPAAARRLPGSRRTATEVLVGPPLRLTPKGSRRIEKPISTSRALAPSRLNKTEPRPTKFRPHFASLSIICLASFGPMPLSSCLK